VRALLALWLLFAASGTVCADTLHGVVIVVIDGDTVLFKPDHYPPGSRTFLKVRLADIDAPETGQPFGEAATEALKARVLKQRAQLEIVATDAYGRKLGHLTVDARSVNADMVRRGLAWAYDSTRASARSGSESFRAYDSTRASARSGSESFRASARGMDRHAMRALQREAQDERIGLWQDAAPTPPWEWRKARAAPAY